MMRGLSFFGTLALVLALANAQIPTDRTESCGSLISAVVSVCSHPTLARPDWCCNELTKWNDAKCWCELNAFDALDTVAGTGAAYSFRDGFCPESFQRPVRGNVIQRYATCEPFDSVADSDGMEECVNVDSVALRTQRFASLDALRDDSVQNDEDLSAWFTRMDELFTEDATYELVGIFLGRGRFEVKQYFMTRQSMYGFMPITADFIGDHFWRNPRMVSYSGGATTSTGYFNKREFVTFEPCSARIQAVYTVEDNYQTRYGQFWRPAETRLMSRYSQTSAEWCAVVALRCAGETYPFSDEADCLSFHENMSNAGQVTCNKFEQAYVPQYSLHGNTLACRSFYLDLAVVDAAGACPAIGREPNQSRCGETQCPGNAFINPFSRDPNTPQYEDTPTHICSDTACREDWPTQAQIDSIPENERSAFTMAAAAPEAESAGAPATTEPTAAPGSEPTPTPIPPEILASDDDELMDSEFENQPVGQPVQTSNPSLSFNIGSINT